MKNKFLLSYKERILIIVMILIQDYLEKTKYYKNKYGKNTIVLMQVGAFYEVYALKNQNGELPIFLKFYP